MIELLNKAWELIKDLNIWTCLGLFAFYGVIFEVIYVKYITCIRDFRSVYGSNLSVCLFLISLWGFSEALNNNIMYAIPICLGTWVGNFVQITLEKRNSEKQKQEGE